MALRPAARRSGEPVLPGDGDRLTLRHCYAGQ
jgi:hypothetical protein